MQKIDIVGLTLEELELEFEKLNLKNLMQNKFLYGYIKN